MHFFLFSGGEPFRLWQEERRETLQTEAEGPGGKIAECDRRKQEQTLLKWSAAGFDEVFVAWQSLGTLQKFQR